MLKRLFKWLIGGESGSRESAVAAFLLLCAAIAYVMYNEANGRPMPVSAGLITWIGAAILGWVSFAFTGKKIVDNNLFNMKGGDDTPQNRGGR